MRLALQQGDTLKIRFVNRLPKVDPDKLNHETDPGEANLFLNPTNLHTHGLLTPARAATRQRSDLRRLRLRDDLQLGERRSGAADARTSTGRS